MPLPSHDRVPIAPRPCPNVDRRVALALQALDTTRLTGEERRLVARLRRDYRRAKLGLR